MGGYHFTSSLRRVSVTIVECALVCPLSVAAQRPRSSTMTRVPALREEVRGSETGDPPAADDHIGVGIAGKLRKLRKRGGRRRVRGGVVLCGGHRDLFQRPSRKSPWHHGASTLFDRLPLPNGPRFQFDKDNVGNSRRDGAEVLQCSPQASLALDPDSQASNVRNSERS
jgi:hypothetical protein